MNHDVFISYSRKDTPIADQICAAFDRAGISYFIDRQGISGGVEFPKVLAPAIKNCKVFLLLASENSYNSSFTRREITYAFKKKNGENMLPYIIDDCEMPDDIDFIFSSTNWRTSHDHPIDPVLVDDVLQLLGRDEECSFNRKAKEEADRKAKEETDRKAIEEAERKAKEEADREAKEAADRKAKEVADRKAKEEADRKAKEEADRRAKEVAGRKAKEEADCKAKEESDLKADNSDEYVVVGKGRYYLTEKDVQKGAAYVRIAAYTKEISSEAFKNNLSLRSIIIHDNVRAIALNAFEGCENLESISIPGSIEVIGQFAFYRCKKLASVTLNEGLKKIENDAFFECSCLKEITIPKSVQKIGPRAFAFCRNLVTVRLLNPETEYYEGTLLSMRNSFPEGTKIIKG